MVYADPTMPLEERCEKLNAALNQALDRNEALQAELAAANARLASFESAFLEGGTLGVLQRMAHDPTLDINQRRLAAAAAVPFERPKLAMTASVQPVKLFDILEARRNAGKVIEQAPVPGPDAA